jgi:uroporphyrin-III C-methyltransferase
VIRKADVVLHDSLTGDEIIDRISESVKVVDVGKRSKERTEQHEIHSLMREKTQNGKTVVRLKGGDPYVFGRGGEETEYLASHDIDFEVVPGISSVLAAPEIARIPLTHRDYASSFTVITGHEDPTKDESSLDWTALARNLVTGGTLIILMGVRRLPDNVTTLLENDVPPETPAAMIEKATWSDEQTVTGTLGTIVERSQAVNIEPPAVTVIGDVVRVRQEMEEWFTA